MSKTRMDVGVTDWSPGDFYMSAAQGAKLIGVSIRRFNRMVERGTIVVDGHVDGERRYLRSQLLRYVQTSGPACFKGLNIDFKALQSAR